MAVFNNQLAGAAGQTGGAAAGYEISRSLRFNSADSAYLSRTPPSAGNRKTWTLSFWVKLCGSSGHLISAGNDAFQMEMRSDGQYLIQNSGCFNNTYSTAVFRDYSAWQHFVIEHDATNTYCKIYVNGSLQKTITASNADGAFNNNTAHNFNGRSTSLDSFTDFYLAEVHFIDGQALDPTDFGEYDNNNWNPKAFSGTYGTNGFRLSFSDNSSNAALGDDSSGNNNDWTVNNLSVASGAGNDSLVDSPTNGTQTDTGAGNEVVGNYATLNPLNTLGSSPSLANGNLQITSTASYDTLSTIGVSSGKWYCELTVTAKSALGIAGIIDIQNTRPSQYSLSGQKYVTYRSTGTVEGNQSGGTGFTWAQGDTLGFALDLDSGTQTLKVYKNGSLQSTSNITASGVTWAMNYFYSEGTSDYTVNFGQRAFAYTAPSGYKALCTANLPDPTIADGSTAMDVKLYTGNGGTQTISGLGFSPDFVWLKKRSGTANHYLYDQVRGATNRLYSNTTDAESTSSTGLTAFTSDGFTVGSANDVNQSSNTYVAWTWDGGTSNATNTDGSITSTVRANASAGSSIVTYSGNLTTTPGTAPTVGHGLNAAPHLIISKSRNPDGSNDGGNWFVNHSYDYSKWMRLNRTNADQSIASSGGGTVANPTSSVFSTYFIAGSGCNNNNYVAYCFAPVEGYSAFGSYTGNGSADGPFVYTGFRPRWVMIKRTDLSNYWIIQDAARNTFNVVDLKLSANAPKEENNLATVGDTSQNTLDYLSNGFKCRTGNAGTNVSNGTYIYAAFAEHPFAHSRAR